MCDSFLIAVNGTIFWGWDSSQPPKVVSSEVLVSANAIRSVFCDVVWAWEMLVKIRAEIFSYGILCKHGWDEPLSHGDFLFNVFLLNKNRLRIGWGSTWSTWRWGATRENEDSYSSAIKNLGGVGIALVKRRESRQQTNSCVGSVRTVRCSPKFQSDGCLLVIVMWPTSWGPTNNLMSTWVRFYFNQFWMNIFPSKFCIKYSFVPQISSQVLVIIPWQDIYIYTYSNICSMIHLHTTTPNSRPMTPPSLVAVARGDQPSPSSTSTWAVQQQGTRELATYLP